MGTLGTVLGTIGGGLGAGFGLGTKSGRNFLFGNKAKDYQRSSFSPEQQPLFEQLLASNMGPGAGGSFGTSADYYRDLLGNNSADFQSFAEPELRRFREDIVPQLAEQFAGMGSGALTGSGFRNAALQAGTSLSERLAALRANLRQQGAQGLFQFGQQGLMPAVENIHRPATGGLLGGFAQGAGQGAGQAGSMAMFG